MRHIHTPTMNACWPNWRPPLVLAESAPRRTLGSVTLITTQRGGRMTAVLGLSEAAQRCGVSVNTIRKRQRDGRLPNTVVDEQGWQIPITDLITDGLAPVSPQLHARRTAAENRPQPQDSGDAVAPNVPTANQLQTLQRLVDAQAMHIEDLRQALQDLRGPR